MGNIPKEVIKYQKKVFDYFNVPLEQIKVEFHNGESVSHAEAIESYLFTCTRETNKTNFIIFDIDCIPLNLKALEYYAQSIEKGILIGPMQRSNHINNNKHIYCGPCALGFNKTIYKPTKFYPSYRADTGEELTYMVEEMRIKTIKLAPSHVELLKWPLKNDNILEFGEGTTYNNMIYHAFNSRYGGSKRFIRKCKEVLKEKEVKPQPIITVVLPISRPELAWEAIKSVYNQDIKEYFQLLLVWDGPNKHIFDETIINKYVLLDQINIPYNTYTTIHSSPGGIPRCIGSAIAQGKYVCYLDEDNTWKSNHLSTIQQLILDTNAEVVYSLRELYSPAGDFVSVDNFESLGPNEGIHAAQGGLIDTNCIGLNRSVLWNTFGGWLSPHRNDDRFMLFNLRANNIKFACTNQATVEYILPEKLFKSSEFWVAQKQYLVKGRIK